MIMQKRRHNHCGLVETFNVQGEDESRCHNEPFDRYNGHDRNMNEFSIHEKDDTVDINLNNDEPMIKFDSSKLLQFKVHKSNLTLQNYFNLKCTNSNFH